MPPLFLILNLLLFHDQKQDKETTGEYKKLSSEEQKIFEDF